MSILVVGYCAVCNDDGKVVPLELVEVDPVDIAGVGAVSAHEWRCPVCLKRRGVRIDYGTLDLGPVRDEQLQDPGEADFWIHTDPAPGQ